MHLKFSINLTLIYKFSTSNSYTTRDAHYSFYNHVIYLCIFITQWTNCCDIRTLQQSSRKANIFERQYKGPGRNFIPRVKEPNYRQIEKQILDDVLGPKVWCCNICHAPARIANIYSKAGNIFNTNRAWWGQFLEAQLKRAEQFYSLIFACHPRYCKIPKVYDARIRPAGINSTGENTHKIEIIDNIFPQSSFQTARLTFMLTYS